ncbi:MAG: hypothetical protein P1S46_10210 [bacterium]|nr:hypothetical protein [bacterium]
MKKMGNLLWCLVLAAAPVHAGSVQPSQFRHMVDIGDGFTPDTPARLTLTEEVLSKTARAFSDLRLFDDTGNEVPYVIYEEIVPGERETGFDFKVRSFDDTGDKVTVLVERPGKEKAYDRIEILTPARDFKKNVGVYSSPDTGEDLPGTWRKLADDTVFDFSSRIDLRKTRFGIPGTSSRYLNLVLTDERQVGEEEGSIRLEYDGLRFEVGGLNDEPFRIDRIRGWRGESRAGEPVLDRKIISRPGHIIDERGDSIYDLGPVNLPVSRVTLRVDRKYYHRRVELMGADSDSDEKYVRVGSGTIYNIPGPDYELAQVVRSEHGKLSSYPEPALKNVRNNPGFMAGKPESTKEITENTAFKIVILVLVLGLAWWLYRLMKKLPVSVNK